MGYIFLLFFILGVTIPPEITIFTASSTFIFIYIKPFLGTNKRNPLVGLGVVGIKTLIKVSLFKVCTSPFVSPVTNPITQIFFLGYSTKTTSLKLSELVDITVSIICLIAAYILLTTGILSRTLSPALSNVLPIKPGVIAPIKVITTKLIINPIPGIWCGKCLVKSKLS